VLSQIRPVGAVSTNTTRRVSRAHFARPALAYGAPRAQFAWQ